jgi:hypothetical protein
VNKCLTFFNAGEQHLRIAWSMALFKPGLVPSERFCFLVALEWIQSAEIDLPRPTVALSHCRLETLLH